MPRGAFYSADNCSKLSAYVDILSGTDYFIIGLFSVPAPPFRFTACGGVFFIEYMYMAFCVSLSLFYKGKRYDEYLCGQFGA